MDTTTNLNINVTANTKALVVIGVTVYVAARMGTAKALKKAKIDQRPSTFSFFRETLSRTADNLIEKVEKDTRPETPPV